MAGRDKRGPEGKGPMTGRGLGYCAGSDRLGYEPDSAPAGRGGGFGRRFRPGAGRGYGCGGGFGRRYGNLVREPVFEPASGIPQTLANELAGLKDYLIALEDRIKDSIE